MAIIQISNRADRIRPFIGIGPYIFQPDKRRSMKYITIIFLFLSGGLVGQDLPNNRMVNGKLVPVKEVEKAEIITEWETNKLRQRQDEIRDSIQYTSVDLVDTLDRDRFQLLMIKTIKEQRRQIARLRERVELLEKSSGSRSRGK